MSGNDQMAHTTPAPEIPRAKTYVPLPPADQDGVVSQVGPATPAIPLKLASVQTPSMASTITAPNAGIYQFSGLIGLVTGTDIRQITFVRRSATGVVTPIQAALDIQRDHFDFFFQAYFAAGDEFLIMLTNPKLIKQQSTTTTLEFFPNALAQPVTVTGFTNLIQVRYLGSDA